MNDTIEELESMRKKLRSMLRDIEDLLDIVQDLSNRSKE